MVNQMPGIKPQRKVKIRWSANFAYAIGLITTDGSLSKDGRHISLISKDIIQLKNCLKCLHIKVKIGIHNAGSDVGSRVFRIQFGDVVFYRFLEEIGLMPNKSKIMGALKIPKKYFFDFLRGHFDGDGSFYSYWDPRWRSSFMYYTAFVSASLKHVGWIREEIFRRLKIKGHITRDGQQSTNQLKFAKKDSLKLLKKLYQTAGCTHLPRKYLKIQKALGIIGQSL